jgi:hypothetical protein
MSNNNKEEIDCRKIREERERHECMNQNIMVMLLTNEVQVNNLFSYSYPS